MNRLYIWIAKGTGDLLSSPMNRFPHRRTVPHQNVGRAILDHNRRAIVSNLLKVNLKTWMRNSGSPYMPQALIDGLI
jgi:hypothetical protein